MIPWYVLVYTHTYYWHVLCFECLKINPCIVIILIVLCFVQLGLKQIPSHTLLSAVFVTDSECSLFNKLLNGCLYLNWSLEFYKVLQLCRNGYLVNAQNARKHANMLHAC